MMVNGMNMTAEEYYQYTSEQYFRANLIYFMVGMSLILFFSAVLTKKIKVLLIANYPNLEEYLETDEEREQRLARIARAN